MTKKKAVSGAAGRENGAAAAPAAEVPARAAPAGAAPAPEEIAKPAAADDEASTPSSAEYTVAFSPRQVVVGLAIVAGLVAIALRHRGRRKPADD